jgi:hypothetical protein
MGTDLVRLTETLGQGFLAAFVVIAVLVGIVCLLDRIAPGDQQPRQKPPKPRPSPPPPPPPRDDAPIVITGHDENGIVRVALGNRKSPVLLDENHLPVVPTPQPSIRLSPPGTKVELLPAYAWHCQDCGTENFCRGFSPELPEEEEREMKSKMGIEPWDQGELLMVPAKVTCKYCGRSFPTEDWRDRDELPGNPG